MTITRLPDNLPKMLRDAGLEVIEIEGWQERERPGDVFFTGVLNHHTGSSAKGWSLVREFEYAKWLFLTGDKEELYSYISKEFLQTVEEMKGKDRQPGFEVLHTTNLMLVDAKGVVRGKYNAQVPEDMAKLRRDVKKLES